VIATTFNGATHFSIIWAVSLAIITLLEWSSLDRNPVRQEIFSPFIERTMTVAVEEAPTPDREGFGEQQETPDAMLRYDVEFHFNGPLFLACFFIPIIIFNGVAILWKRLRGQSP
jgi:hypothetical protein